MYERSNCTGGSGTADGVNELDAVVTVPQDGGVLAEPLVGRTYVRVMQRAGSDLSWGSAFNRIVLKGAK